MFEQSYQNQFNADEGLRRHVQRTFGWMAVGLLITALSAAFFYFTGISMQIVLTSSAFMWLGILLQLGVVVAFMSGLHRRNLGMTRMMFFAYSILTGFTFSLLGWLYDAQSVMFAFAITAVYFGSLCVIGYTTKVNLMPLGRLLFVSLIILIIVEVVMMLMGFSTDTLLLSAVGLLIFTGLTAYDTQKMKQLYLSTPDEQSRNCLAVYSAFELYLDFINIFMYILRFVGNRD